jgi:uncharacterized protein (TIGR00369 family)
MPVPATSSPDLLKVTRGDMHPRCVVCGRVGPAGLGLEFRLLPDGSVTGSFDCNADFEGYAGMLHGGVISAIADGAMTNCLFAHGIAAVTAELNVQFRHPIELGLPLTVTAKMGRHSGSLFLLKAELTQSGQLKARATGKFAETLTGPTPETRTAHLRRSGSGHASTT